MHPSHRRPKAAGKSLLMRWLGSLLSSASGEKATSHHSVLRSSNTGRMMVGLYFASRPGNRNVTIGRYTIVDTS